MPPPDPRHERRALLASIAVTAALGSLGVVWGVLTGSQMILFDGVYAFVGILVSWLLLRASDLSGREPTRRFPYGLEATTPLAIGVQGFVLLATLLYAAVEAVFTIRAGGTDITAGWAIAYGVVTSVGSLAFWLWLRRQTSTSDVVRSEAAAWLVAAWRGVGMVVGFSLMGLLAGSRWDGAAAYVDPVMVLVTCVAFLGTPIRLVRATFVELLEGAPAREIEEPVRAAVAQVAAEHRLGQPDVRMTKVGPKLYVEVDARAEANRTIAEADDARAALEQRLAALPFDVWLNFELLPHRPA